MWVVTYSGSAFISWKRDGDMSLFQQKSDKCKGLSFTYNRGIFLDFFSSYYIQHCFICLTSDTTVLEDAGIDQEGCDFGIGSQTL
jgi:hypothetical protein